MKKTTIYYYSSASGNQPFGKFLDSLTKSQQTKVLRLIMQIEEYGLTTVLPHTKKLSGTPLWELRILGKDNIRIIYVVPHQDSVLVLHGFTKKTQKTPHKELGIAINRYKEWQTDH